MLQDMVQLLIKAKETGLLERDAEFTKRFVDMQIGLADGTKTVQEVLAPHRVLRTLGGTQLVR